MAHDTFFTNPRRDVVDGAIAYMGKHLRDRISLEQLSAITRLSVFHFSTLFRKEVGVAPYRYLCMLRVERAQILLRQGRRPSDVAIEVGFFDQSHLSRHFKNICGMTPGRYVGSHYREYRPGSTHE